MGQTLMKSPGDAVPHSDQGSDLLALTESTGETGQVLENRALRAAYDEARAGSRAKTAFLASVSHELRTPLNGIMGFAQMIAENALGTNCDARYREYASHIVTSSQKLMNLLGDIMDMARLEAGRMTVQREVVTIQDAFLEAMAVVLQRQPIGPDVETRFDAQFPEMWTDRRHLGQILVNLISNARDYTPDDGKVTFSAHLAPNDDAEIAVSDTGRGMSPDELKQAVTRFGHAEQEMRRQSGGIGLGLPLAKSYAELLGGSLRIASEPGQGTTVTVGFPRESLRAQAAQWRKPADRMEERRRRLLANSEVQDPADRPTPSSRGK